MRKLTMLLLMLPIFTFGNDIKCILPEGTQWDMLSNENHITNRYYYRFGPKKELYLISGNICLNYYNQESQVYAFPPSFNATDVFWLNDEGCLFSDSSSVYYRDGECDSVFCLIHTDMNDIRFRASNYGIYYYDSNGTDLWFFSYPRAESIFVCRFPNSISGIDVMDDICFIAYGGDVGMISRNQEYSALFKVPTTISSLAVGEDGSLFYGTENGLFYYDCEERQYPIIANHGVRELLIEGDELYIIFRDGSSAKLKGISAYKEIADEIEKLNNHEKDYSDNINEKRMLLMNGQIEQLLSFYSKIIQSELANRNAGKGVSGDLLAEYAYTLALHHDFEAALVNIDRARAVGTKYRDFYSAQILTLMRHDDAAQQLMRQAKVPEWIDGIYQGLTDKYKTTASINRDAPDVALKRANKLAANRQTIQAMALFEELAAIYPNSYIIYVDYSTVWESLGYYAHAAQLLQKGIGLMPVEQSENKQIFQNHLTKVNEHAAKYENASWMKRFMGMDPPKLMTYAGASIAKDSYMFNGRMGLYTSKQFSTSLNMGLGYVGGQFSGDIGVSAYKTWKVFVGGLGLADRFSKDDNTFNLTASAGLTFLNKSQTSSFDIMVTGYFPFTGGNCSYSVSIGKTIYFDLNRKQK